MIDIPKAKADAEEGLRIAENAQGGPWFAAYSCVHSEPITKEYDRLEALIPDDASEDHPGWDALPNPVVCAIERSGHGDLPSARGAHNGAFIADSRTRAPEAYRNVIEMAGVIDGLNRRLGEVGELYGMALFDNERLVKERDEAIADYNRSIANREQDLAEFRALSARVTAAELAEEKMTRKAQEHYDRAVKAEAERDALRLDVVRLRSENEKHLEQSWAFETEIEQLREQLDKYVDVKFAKDVS